jgi:transcriptional regulator with XRE-family HTH domain
MSLTCGEVLKRLRLKNGLSQDAFGKIMGWGFVVKHLEQNQTHFTRVRLEQLIHAGYVVVGDRFYKAFIRIFDKEERYDLPDTEENALDVLGHKLSDAIYGIDHNPRRVIGLKIDLEAEAIFLRRKIDQSDPSYETMLDEVEEMPPEESRRFIELLNKYSEEELQMIKDYWARRDKVDKP